MIRLSTKSILLIAFSIALYSCSKEEDPLSDNGEVVFGSDLLVSVNPSGRNPLSAQVVFSTADPSMVNVLVKGARPVSSSWKTYSNVHRVPIIGLYPDTVNEVVLTIRDNKGRMSVKTLKITTEALYEGLPDITINSFSEGQTEDGMILTDCHFGNDGFFTSYPFVFDNDGVIRWCLDIRDFKEIAWVTQRIKNGNYICITKGGIHEFDALGFKVRFIPLSGYISHHEIFEMPNGNFLVAVAKDGATIEKNGSIASVDDHILEVSPSGAILREWDLRKVLDVDRITLTDGAGDWFHMNGMAYSESDDCIIVSGRNQCVAKIDANNQLKWIMAPHKDWGKAGAAGDGFETSDYLLTAVDALGQPHSAAVQNGDARESTFDWPWGQHAPFIMPNGNLMFFDNGFNRQFTGADKFSRAVEYQIDETAMEVKEVWSFGEALGSNSFSIIISNADYHQDAKTVLFAAGFAAGGNEAHIIETSYPGKSVVFDAKLTFKNLTGSGVFGWGTIDIVYRAHRFEMYP